MIRTEPALLFITLVSNIRVKIIFKNIDVGRNLLLLGAFYSAQNKMVYVKWTNFVRPLKILPISQMNVFYAMHILWWIWDGWVVWRIGVCLIRCSQNFYYRRLWVATDTFRLQKWRPRYGVDLFYRAQKLPEWQWGE